MSDRQPCRTCGSLDYNRSRIFYEGNTLREFCNKCTELGNIWLPDQYLPGGVREQTDPNICNPETGKPIPFSTKREKAIIMRQLGIKYADCNEKQHGRRNDDIWKWRKSKHLGDGEVYKE